MRDSGKSLQKMQFSVYIDSGVKENRTFVFFALGNSCEIMGMNAFHIYALHEHWCVFLCALRRALLAVGYHRGCMPAVCQQSKIIGLQQPSHTLRHNGSNEHLGSGCHTDAYIQHCLLLAAWW